MMLRGLSVLFIAFGACLEAAPQSSNESESDVVQKTLPPIYVTRDRAARDPGLDLSLSSEDLSLLTPDHPAETINVLPGVNVQMNSGQEHLIALRSPVLTGGAGQGSYLIMENGLPTRSAAFGNVNALFEPVHELAKDVEVIVGPGSAKYGSNAVHGIINFGLPQRRGSTSHLHAAVSSLGRQKLEALGRPFGDETIAGAAIQNDTGWRDNTDVDQQKLYLAHDFEFGSWGGLAWMSMTNLNQETAGFMQGKKAYKDRAIARSNPNPEAYRDARSLRAAVQFISEGERVDWRITPYARWQEMEFRQHFLPYKGIEENGHSAFGVQLRVDKHIDGNIDWRFGGDVDFASGFLTETQNDPFFPGDTRFPVGTHYDYEVDTSVLALWTELDVQLTDQFSVLLGLRGETHAFDYSTRAPVGINGLFNVAANREDEFDLVTPKIGAVYAFENGPEVYANVARGSRAPQASDLYRLQSQQLAGEAKVESLDSIELGIRGELGIGGRAAYQIAGYIGEKENFFFRDSQGLNVTDGATEHKGVDAQLRIEPLTDTMFVVAAISWSDHAYTFDRIANGIVSGNKIDTAPEWLADLSVTWRGGDNWALSGEAEYIGAYFTNPANTREYPGHVVAHASASIELPKGVEVYARIRNLFDLKYADRADFAFGNERYFPGEPLNVTVGFRKSFGQ